MSPVENHKPNNTMTEILKAIRAELIDPLIAALNNLTAALGNAPVPTAPAQTPEPAPKKERKAKPTPPEEAQDSPPSPTDDSPAAAETPPAEAPAADAPGITFEDIKAHVESIRSMPDAQEKRERIKKFLNKECGGAQSTAECDPQYYPKLLKGLQKLGATDTRKTKEEET